MKTDGPAMGPWVQIPPLPPFKFFFGYTMFKQKGSGDILTIFAVVFILCLLVYLTNIGENRRELEFENQCIAHNGYVLKEGVSFLSGQSDKTHSKLKSLCVDDKDRIIK